MHGHKVQNLSSVVIVFSQIIMYFFEFKVNFQSNLKKGKKNRSKGTSTCIASIRANAQNKTN
jgi:hypothetical protein